jgi:hypothetical protein
MDKFVARQRSEHYRDKLATETNEERRQMLLRLLADEEAKLAAPEKTPQRKRLSV